MNLKKYIKNKILFLLAVILLAGGVLLFIKYGSRTKIGLINFPDYMYVKVRKANTNNFIKLVQLRPDSLPDLTGYDMLLVWGMGIRIAEDQEAKILKAKEKGVKIYLHSATNPRLQFTNIEGAKLDAVSDYLDNSGTENFKNLLNYIRKEINGKKWFINSFDPPKKYPDNVFFYTDEGAIFNTRSEFENYCLEKGFHKKNADKVVLFTSVPGPFNANRDHLNSIITELQARNLNVYPVSGMTGRLNVINGINPSLIVYMPHGRLEMGGDGDLTVKKLKELNIPVICPLSVLKDYKEWLKDKQGMIGGMLGQSVTMPELDGGIIPYALVAQYEDKDGLQIFKAVPERLKGFGTLVQNYLSLKHKMNRDKKIAIVYYKGHGKNALEAAGLEVLPSLYNFLKRLKNEGYTVTLPNNLKDFEEEIMQKGPVFGPYAQGAFDRFLKSGFPAYIPVNEYESWCKQDIPAEKYNEVTEKYGKAPGSYMAVSSDSGDYMAVARVAFGNVVLLPQPLPGLGDNAFQLIHGANVAPPHSYISPYLWIKNKFKADAVFHFGTHGSLEFTPGKQIALSNYDWPDMLIGTTPHFYFYTISDPGEAMMAKRRSYAVTLSHVTPPFISSMLLDNKKIIRDKLDKYENAQGAIKTEYALAIKKIAVEEGYTKDLGLDNNPQKPLDENQMQRLTNYLDELDNEKITAGLYTLGIPYPEDKINSTVEIMSSEALAYALANLDVYKGVIAAKDKDNLLFFTKNYLNKAKTASRTMLNSGNPQSVFNKLVNNNDFNRAILWNNTKSGEKIPLKTGKNKYRMENKQPDTKFIENMVVKIISQNDKKDFLLKLKSQKEYDRAIKLLDPEQRAKAMTIAKFIPAMKSALLVAEDSSVIQLLTIMKRYNLRDKIIQLCEDQNLKSRVEREKLYQDSLLVCKALADSNRVALSVIIRKENVYSARAIVQKQNFYAEQAHTLVRLLKKVNDPNALAIIKTISSAGFKDLQEQNQKILNHKEQLENDLARLVFEVKNTLENIVNYKLMLQNAPENEFKSALNALQGGYTAPSPGGDPVSNPLTLPTGRNLISVNAEITPSKEAWNVGKKLGDAMLSDYLAKHGKLPEKVSYTFWSGEFIETEGATIAQALYMLGVEPVWDAFGRVQDIRLIPTEELNRPRIDIVVQTSGQMRDLAASRLYLLSRAVTMAASASDKNDNYVKKGVDHARKYLLDKGLSPKQAEEMATARIFGGVNGNYGTNISGMVEKGDSYENPDEIAVTYINNMGAVYGSNNNWGEHYKGVFEAALLHTDVVVQPRQSNTWGALSLDHVYEFMGGMNLAVKKVTGTDAESYMSDYRNSSNPRIQGLKDAIWVEARTTLLNQRYIKEYMKGGASSAETFAETFRNTFAWNVMKPSAIDSRLWEELYQTYVKDEQHTGVQNFFNKENPYALQEITAVMLETVRKGLWKATPEQVKTIATLHVQLVDKHDAGCSGFVCDNAPLRKMISQTVTPEQSQKYQDKISEARDIQSKENGKSQVLKKEEKTNTQNLQQTISNNSKTIGWVIGGILVLGILVIIRLKNKK